MTDDLIAQIEAAIKAKRDGLPKVRPPYPDELSHVLVDTGEPVTDVQRGSLRGQSAALSWVLHQIDEARAEPSRSSPDPDLDVERLRRIARNALNTWVGRNWPSMEDMRYDGIGAGLVEKPGKPDQAIRRYLDTFQPDLVLDLLSRLGSSPDLTGLDPERLAEAIHQTHKFDDPNDRAFCPACLSDAQRYAAEYARLSPAPETDPSQVER